MGDDGRDEGIKREEGREIGEKRRREGYVLREIISKLLQHGRERQAVIRMKLKGSFQEVAGMICDVQNVLR